MSQTAYEACADAMGGYFKEGMNILDYGCGPGYFADHMNSRLKDFTYFGVEPISSHGLKCIPKAIRRHRRDGRMTFDYIGTPTEDFALKQSEAVLLLSVFTHLDIDQTESILAKFMPVIKRNGRIFFTMILGDEYSVGRGGMYGLKETYSVVYNTKEQVDHLANKFQVHIESKGQWLQHGRGGTWLHDIYQMRLPDAAD